MTGGIGWLVIVIYLVVAAVGFLLLYWVIRLAVVHGMTEVINRIDLKRLRGND